MRVEVMEHYGLTQSIEQAGYYETAHHKQLMKDIKGAIREGRLIAVCGVVEAVKPSLCDACSSNCWMKIKSLSPAPCRWTNRVSGSPR